MIKKFLTSNYDKSPTSAISKLNKIISEEIKELKDTLRGIELTNDIDNAQGQMLDDIGANYMQYRGEANDGVYRALIKSKIARNRADGTLDNLHDVLSLALGVSPDTIGLAEGLHPTYASVKVLEVPIGVLTEIGMSAGQLGRLINTMISAGVKLESIDFEGTFEYVGEIVFSPDLGYSDTNMNNGGVLGDVYFTSKDDIFPL